MKLLYIKWNNDGLDEHLSFEMEYTRPKIGEKAVTMEVW